MAAAKHGDYFGGTVWGIDTSLATILEVGLTVKQYVYVDTSQLSTCVARHHLHQLMVLYPQQLPPTTIRGCFSRLPRDVTLINEANLRHLGPVDMVIAGWPCQGHSNAGAGRGLEDPRSSIFWDLIRLMQWWFSHQLTPLGCIFKNVPLLGHSWNKVLEGGHYVCQHLGDPIFVDATNIGSYAYRPRWIWTNLAPSSTLAATFFAVPPPFDQRWMTSWIRTGHVCRLFEMIYPRWHWSTKWGYNGRPFSFL